MTTACLAAALCACAGEPDNVSSAGAGSVQAPTQQDPVADWERELLPAIDTHMAAGRLDSVIAICTRGLAQDSSRIVLYNLMAAAQAGGGQYDLAVGTLQTAVRLSPDFVEGWINLGSLQAELGRFEEAVPALERVVALDSAGVALRRRLGVAYLGTGRYAEAAAEFDAALAQLPGDATVIYLLGRSQEGRGLGSEALASYLLAGRLDPGFADTHGRAAELADELSQAQVADSCRGLVTRLQQIGGGEPRVLESVQRLRMALRSAPEEAVHHARLGGAYMAHGYRQEALPLFERAATLEPGNVRLLNEIGGVLAKRDDVEHALGYYLRALEASPEFAPALVNAGGALNALQRPAEALPHLEKALTVAGDDPTIRYYLGVTLASLGRLDDARLNLERATQLVGDGNPALKGQIEAMLSSLDG